MAEQKTCKDRVKPHLKSRIHDLELLFRAYQNGNEETVTETRTFTNIAGNKETYTEELGVFHEYGLSFDYVAPGTFEHQKRGYFRYQLSYGGPSDEFRFYTDENFNLTSIQYWFLDWFDGASIRLKGRDYDLMSEIWDFFKEVGSVESEHQKAMEG